MAWRDLGYKLINHLCYGPLFLCHHPWCDKVANIKQLMGSTKTHVTCDVTCDGFKHWEAPVIKIACYTRLDFIWRSIQVLMMEVMTHNITEDPSEICFILKSGKIWYAHNIHYNWRTLQKLCMEQLDLWFKDKLKITFVLRILSIQMQNCASCGKVYLSHMSQYFITLGSKYKTWG